jgi:hypothetical protein
MLRFRTYQEGTLAKKLLFQFADRVYSFNESLERLLDIKGVGFLLTFQGSLAQRSHELHHKLTTKLERFNKIATATRALKYRNTSLSSDETVCLANLLGCDNHSILQTASPSSRMVKFWKMLRDFPIDVIFDRSEKLKQIGFRWTSRTLLRDESDVDAAKLKTTTPLGKYHGAREAVWTEDGLNFSCGGHNLRYAYVEQICRGFGFKTERGTWYVVHEPPNSKVPLLRVPEQPEKSTLMLITDQHDNEETESGDWRSIYSHGVLVSSKASLNNRRFVSLVCHIEFEVVRSQMNAGLLERAVQDQVQGLGSTTPL